MPDLEAIGDAATGAVIARAIEPKAGAAADGHTHERNCLNCGAELAGAYCHACGQRAHVHRTLMAFWHDLAHGVLHLDGKIWRTLPMLVWRPGELTRRYVDGERARFVSPMALFLFSVFLMFAVFSLVDSPFVTKQTASVAGVATNQEIAIEQRMARGFVPEKDVIATIDARPSANGDPRISTGSKSVDDWFNRAYKKAKENPRLLLYKLQSNAYKFSWLLIPISIPLVWLLFLNRRRYRQEFTAYDHTVFVTYSIAFMSLAAIALSLLGWIGFPGGILSLAVLIVPPVHIYRQLKGAYGLSRGSALWRTAMLLILAFVALILFGFLLLTLGVFG